MNDPPDDISPQWRCTQYRGRIAHRPSRVLPTLWVPPYTLPTVTPRENTHKHPFSLYYVLHYKMQQPPPSSPTPASSIICMRDADVLPSNEACRAGGPTMAAHFSKAAFCCFLPSRISIHYHAAAAAPSFAFYFTYILPNAPSRTFPPRVASDYYLYHYTERGMGGGEVCNARKGVEEYNSRCSFKDSESDDYAKQALKSPESLGEWIALCWGGCSRKGSWSVEGSFLSGRVTFAHKDSIKFEIMCRRAERAMAKS